MEHHAIILYFLFIWMKSSVFGFQVKGDISITNDTETVENASAGDSITVSFNLNLELESEYNDVLFVFHGDSVKFPDVPSYRAVSWNLSLNKSNMADAVANDAENNATYSNMVVEECVDTNGSIDANETIVEGCYNNTDNIDERMTFSDTDRGCLTVNLTASLQPGNWSFDGMFDMEIGEDTVQGSIVRAILAIWVIENGTWVSTKYAVSDYIVIPAPDIDIYSSSPLTQPILGLFQTYVTLNTSRDSLSAVIGCLTPYENATNEVMLTVQSMRVRYTQTLGVHQNTTDFLQIHGRGTLTSTIGSYQNNKAVMILSNIPRYTDEYSSMEVKSLFVVRVEDYSQLADGDIFPMLISLRFHDSWVWMGEVLVTLDAPDVRKPSLTVTTSQLYQCPYDGSTTATMSVLVAHDVATSTATAYNVTLNIYLPFYINMKTNQFTTPKENQITVGQEGHIVNAEIARLTFSDPFTLTLQLDLDLSDIQILDAENRLVTAEALYNDRWGNVTDLMTETAYTSLSIKKHCAKRISWGVAGSCLAGACPCNTTSHCVPCGELWRCEDYKLDSHVGKLSRIDGILCEASLRRRSRVTQSSCYKELSGPRRYMHLSPRVGLITGQDSSSKHYYGISNNAATYVISTDGALTWTSLFPDIYQQIIARPSFKWATFI